MSAQPPAAGSDAGRSLFRAAIAAWRRSLPELAELVAVPALSAAFDPEGAASAHLAAAAELLRQVALRTGLPGLTAEVVTLEGRSPTLCVTVPATPGLEEAPPALLYGHYDRQPPLGSWRAGLAPFAPVREGDRLYGRGAADDAWAAFGAFAALVGLAETGWPQRRVVLLVEGSEESGSPDLPAYLDRLRPEIGRPDLVVALDTGGPTADRLWRSASLRGLVNLVLRVSVLTEGVHSGSVGGVVPDSFRILRQLLDRLEDPETGRVRLAGLWADPPAAVRQQAEALAAELADADLRELPTRPGLRLDGESPVDRLLRRTWQPTLAVIGQDGMPSLAEAGNVLRPTTALGLSIRLPPTVPAEPAAEAVRGALRADPPSGAQVDVEIASTGDGFFAGRLPDWLTRALDDASEATFGRRSGVTGEGGSIPFLAALSARYPEAAIVATGVLTPGTNAHGPNESLHLPTAERVTACLAWLLAAQAAADTAPAG